MFCYAQTYKNPDAQYNLYDLKVNMAMMCCQCLLMSTFKRSKYGHMKKTHIIYRVSKVHVAL